MKTIPNSKMGYLFAALVVLLLLGLPIAVWIDLNRLVETNLRRQASDVNSIISSVRNYYANNVVGRVLASPVMTRVVHNYRDIPGAIPIPATLSLELGKVISEQQRSIELCRTSPLRIAHHTRLMNSRPPRSVSCVKIQISS